MTRVAITGDRFEAAAAPYAVLGLDPVPIPCIRVEAADDDELASARAAATRADLIVITSARTVELLWPEQDMPEVEVAAVGEATAAAVTDAGGEVVATGLSGLSGLVDVIADRLPHARVMLPHASGSDLPALERLRALARVLNERVIYRTVPIAPASTSVEAVVFASPSAVEGWLMNRDFDQLVLGVIGDTTGAAVAPHRPPDVIAPKPSHSALARALRSYLEVTV